MPGQATPRPHRVVAPAAGPATPASPAVAARLRQLAAQAEHRRAIADYQARHAADQQARINALLQEAIAALAGLLGAPPPGTRPRGPAGP